MVDEPKAGGAVPFVERDRAPVIFFDGAPTMAAFNGVVALSLSVTFYEPSPNGKVNIEGGTVAHLRTNIEGARALRAAIDGALLLAQPAVAEGQAN